MVFLKRFSARDLIFYLLAILVMVFTFNAVQQMNEPDDPTYNEIRLLFEQEKVKYFSVEDNVLTLTLRGEGEDTSTLKYHLADFNVFYNDLHDDYTGEILVMLLNTSGEERILKRGERMAQLVFQPFVRPVWQEVESLSATERGAGGFGHTGR